MPSSLTVGLSAFVLCLVASPAAMAEEEAGEQPAGEQPAEEQPAEEQPAEEQYRTVVTGKRPPRSASDWTFKPRAGALRAGATAAELLPMAPGLHISQHGGAGKAHQIFLRGFDAVHGQDLEINAGGIPVNEVSNIHGQGYADLNFIIPEAVSRMRVLEGAFDPRQGDFAVAGSVDLDLGLQERGILARVSGGSYGTVRGLVAWGPESRPRETFVAAELARADGFGPARTWRRGNVMGQALIKLGAGIRLRLLGTSHAARFGSAGVVRVDDYRSGAMDFHDTYDDLQGGTTDRHQALVEVSYRGDATRASLSLYGLIRGLRLRHNFTGFMTVPNEKQAAAGANKPQGDLQEQLNDTVAVGGRGHVRRNVRLLGETHALEAGVIWRHDRVEQAQQRLRAVDGRPWLQEVDAALIITDIGLYADLNVTLPADVRLRVGLRADALAYAMEDRLAGGGQQGNRDAFGFHVGPKATLEWRPLPRLRLFGSYGNGFRSPQALSLGQGESAPFTSVHAGELGGRLRAGQWLDLTLAGFVTHVAQDLIFDHASGKTVATGGTTRGGVSLMVESRPLSWLHGTLGATYTRAVLDESGEVLPYAPPLVLRLDLDARRGLTQLWGRDLVLFGGLGIGLVGPRPLPYGEQTRTVTLVDLGVGLELSPVSLSVELFNLADVRWRDGEFVYASSFDQQGPRSLVPARHFTAGRPFTAQGTLTLLF